MTDPGLLREGSNCWRRVSAGRVAFLVDAEAYFSAVADAIERARRSVIIVGWDLHTEVQLRRDGKKPAKLGEVLLGAVRKNRGLQVRVLLWDYAVIYALERQPLPLLSFVWLKHRRIQVHHDDTAPAGASHHHKLVVIDGLLAFAGGIDLTLHRWDTRAHRGYDPRRHDGDGEVYEPFHDVQVAVDGEAARALGEVAARRWQRATGKRLPLRAATADPWPGSLEPDLRQARVGIARTLAADTAQDSAQEVEQLFLDCIAAARRSIYIENQYLTSFRVCEALSKTLRRDSGPEVVIVLPNRSSGWLEQSTMDVLRTRALQRLESADRHGRLLVVTPIVPGESGPVPVYVHAKVMVVDDWLARVGSANLSNRSMGFDSECDVALDGTEQPAATAAIARFRNDLLAEHLGTSPEAVAERLAETGSLIATIRELSSAGRTLSTELEPAPEWLMEAVPHQALVDPERPISLESWVLESVPRSLWTDVEINVRLIGVLALLASAAVVLYSASSPDAWWVTWLPAAHWRGGLALLGGFVAAAFVPLPVTVLILLAVLGYGTALGAGLSGLGLVLNAGCSYWFGTRLRRSWIRRMAGGSLNRISRRLGRRGAVAVMTLRALPLAPFAVVGLVAGAARTRVGDYALGTLIGMLPNLGVVVLLIDRVRAAALEPTSTNLGLLTLVLLVTAGGAFLVARRLNQLRSGTLGCRTEQN